MHTHVLIHSCVLYVAAVFIVHDADVVIRRRLLTRTSTLGKTGLKKCAENLLSLLDAFADESVEPDVWCVPSISCKRTNV